MDSAHIVAVDAHSNKNAPNRARFCYQPPIVAVPISAPDQINEGVFAWLEKDYEAAA